MLIREALFYGRNFLKEHTPIDSSVNFLNDSCVILERLLGMSREKILLSDDILSEKCFNEFVKSLTKYIDGTPIEYIINSAKFMGLDFYVDENVLIPRSDTEILVETVMNFIKTNTSTNQKINLLDLCCGSGCIGVAIQKENQNKFPLRVVGIDISYKAIDIAKLNAKHNRVKINYICDDIFIRFAKHIDNNFNFIVSNPPYIKTSDINKLDKSVKNYEPHIALDGGIDGLKFYKFIIKKIKHECIIFFEIDSNMTKQILEILYDNNFSFTKVIKDINNNDRVVVAHK
jgi:release factor glutamine methyltransferase